MAKISTWTELLAAIFFVFVALTPIPETSCASYPLHKQSVHQYDKNKIGSESSSSGRHSKKRRVLKVSKNVFNKLRDQLEEEKLEMNAVENHPQHQSVYKEQLSNNRIQQGSRFSPTMKTRATKEEIVPYYDCPMSESSMEGNAIIKADPYDCSRFYYCNWGVHYVQECAWPLLWNGSIKGCDWYWRVKCQTYGYDS